MSCRHTAAGRFSGISSRFFHASLSMPEKMKLMKLMKDMKRALVLIAVVSLLTVSLAGEAPAQAGRVKPAQAAASEAEANAGSAGGGFLGVFLADVNETRAKELNLSEVRGALVGQVVKDSPAARAGLQENDVLLGFNNEPVQSAAQLYRLLIETPPGRTVNLAISRSGKLLTLPATLGERQAGRSPLMGGTPEITDQMITMAEKSKKDAEILRQKFESSGEKKLLEQAEELEQQAEDLSRRAEEQKAENEKFRKEGQLRGFLKPEVSAAAPRPRLGVKVLQLSEQLGKYFSVPGNTGVLVTEIEPHSLAARAGLKAGDCIFEVNGQKVQSRDDVARLLSEASQQVGSEKRSEAEVPVKIMRDHKEQTLRLETERR